MYWGLFGIFNIRTLLVPEPKISVSKTDSRCQRDHTWIRKPVFPVPRPDLARDVRPLRPRNRWRRFRLCPETSLKQNKPIKLIFVQVQGIWTHDSRIAPNSQDLLKDAIPTELHGLQLQKSRKPNLTLPLLPGPVISLRLDLCRGALNWSSKLRSHTKRNKNTFWFCGNEPTKLPLWDHKRVNQPYDDQQFSRVSFAKSWPSPNWN